MEIPVAGILSTTNCRGQIIFVVDTHRGGGKRFVVHADDKLIAFFELECQVLTAMYFRDSRHHRVIAEGVAEVQPSGAESPKKGEQ